MPGTAYIFPGQGSQYVGMGKDLYEKHVVARDLFDAADSMLGFSISKICFEGPEQELKQTKNTQPAIFLHSLAVCRLTGHNGVTMTAGHSLGEYSALVFAEAMTFEDGLKVVRLRGELMQRAGEEQQGTMAAVVGLEKTIVDEVCQQARVAGVVQAANFNSPGQVVISGSVAGVRRGMEIARERGAKLVKELIVSGAFHSPLMQHARQGLKAALEKTTIRDARIPIFANVTAQPVQKAAEIRTLLGEQLTQAVRWEESIQHMIASGTTTFMEIGPGKVLQGLVKRINTNVEVSGIDTAEDVEKLVTLST